LAIFDDLSYFGYFRWFELF